jgi:limonene-1,2-epoxide hydrolase
VTSSNTVDVNFEKLFASIDAMDTESFLGFIAEDCTFRFGSSPEVKGHAGIASAVEDFFSMFAALEHKLHRFIADDKAVVCEGEVTYTRHDGSKVTLPFANVFEVKNRLITLYRIYIDIGPLFTV